MRQKESQKPETRSKFIQSLTEEIAQSVSKETLVQGVLRCRGDMFFNGKLEGVLIHGLDPEDSKDHVLEIGPKARIKGCIFAKSISLQGYVEGEIFATQILHITHLGYVLGDVNCKNLKLDYGGVINGSSHMNVDDLALRIQEKITALKT